ncbi:hypothetical protein MMC29_001424, partial [Sticta canariensis]|nr:hypothetical protein [Sticta canariensis]
MRWTIYLTFNVLSVPFIGSTVIKPDFSRPIEPFIDNSDIESLSAKFNPDILNGVALIYDPNVQSDCLFGNRESTNQTPKRQVSSSRSICPGDRQNKEPEVSAPILESLQGGPLNLDEGVSEGAGGSGAQPEILGPQLEAPAPFNGIRELPGSSKVVPFIRFQVPVPHEGDPPPTTSDFVCPSSFKKRQTPVCDSGNPEDVIRVPPAQYQNFYLMDIKLPVV